MTGLRDDEGHAGLDLHRAGERIEIGVLDVAGAGGALVKVACDLGEGIAGLDGVGASSGRDGLLHRFALGIDRGGRDGPLRAQGGMFDFSLPKFRVGVSADADLGTEAGPNRGVRAMAALALARAGDTARA